MLPSFGTNRFQLLREIGHGGMGVVYAALDRERNLEVALKLIRRLSPDTAYAFKQEFRSVMDIVHPNLIGLHELFAEGEQLFFTMELIAGEHFLQFVRGKEAGVGDTARTTTRTPVETPTTSRNFAREVTHTAVAREQLQPTRSRPLPEAAIGPPRVIAKKPLGCDLERLRHALRQVAQGLVAVHARGRLHRDIKSSNVMVTAQGRAVILDFGLASAIEDLNRTKAHNVVGTLAYASPEQTLGEQLTPASDWYSVGVMMFEALTGSRPLSGGDTESVVQRKLTIIPPAPEELIEGVPEDLNALCNALLHIDPTQRPAGSEVLEMLKVGTPTYYVGKTPSAVDFIGRERELSMLESALKTAREGSAAVALIHGPSGFGKSSLIQKFLNGLSLRDTLVLRGRCFEQESVPYKGIDSAVDTLAEQLDEWKEVVSEIDVSALGALVHAFPALLQSRVVRKQSEEHVEVVDPQMRRRAAFQCLRDILYGIRSRRQVILCIDDMQWSDAESVQLLSSLLAPPDAPAVLYISSYRSEYEDRNPWLQQWLEVVKASGTPSFSIPVGRFSTQESERLVTRILGSRAASKGVSAMKIVAEGEGNPFFISQLAQSVRQQGAESGALADGTTLDGLLRSRVETLPPEARDLMEVIAVAGQPIAKSDAYAAAGLEQQDPVKLNILRIANLTRSFTFGDVEMVETYHDRIRECVAQSLPPDRARSRHEALALQLEMAGGGDPETLAVHFEAADKRTKAANYYEVAANRAATALAFEKAARYFQKVLALRDSDEAERRRVRSKLAYSLANAGRGYAAAEVYDELSQQANPSETTELERRAGFLYCSTGHLDQGLKVYDRIVSRLGLRDPRGRRMLVANIVYQLLALQFRGLNYELRGEEEEVSPALLARVDTTWSLAAGLAIIDISRAMNFGLMGLRAALKAGDPERLLNAILMTCWIPVMTRIGGRPMADRLLDIATELAALIDTPKAQAVLEQAKATVCNGSSEWENTLLHLENAERIYRNHCTGVSWELATANTLYLYTKYMVGDFVEMGRRAEATIKDASETGDLYSSTIAETFPAPLWHLALDNPVEARRRAKNGLASWSTQGYDVQNAMGWMASGYIDFYEGQPVRFLSFVDKEWQLMSQYGFAQHPAMRGPVLSFWVRALLAKAALPETTASQRRKLWDQAERKLKMLKESPGDFSAAMYPGTLGEMAEARGDREAALRAFAESEKRYADLAMKAYVAAVQRKRGLVMGVRTGDSLVLDAEEKLRSYGVSKPSRFAGMLVGGRQPKP